MVLHPSTDRKMSGSNAFSLRPILPSFSRQSALPAWLILSTGPAKRQEPQDRTISSKAAVNLADGRIRIGISAVEAALRKAQRASRSFASFRSAPGLLQLC
jgi:hypothetical protein